MTGTTDAGAGREIARVADPERDGLFAMLDAFLGAVGEPPLDDAARRNITAAVAGDRIRFFLARIDGQPAGVCSLTTAWSTFSGGAPCGMLDDVLVAPEHRGTGLARALVERMRAEAREQGCSSVIVGCSPDDAPMYRALGFDVKLGVMLSNVLGD